MPEMLHHAMDTAEEHVDRVLLHLPDSSGFHENGRHATLGRGDVTR